MGKRALIQPSKYRPYNPNLPRCMRCIWPMPKPTASISVDTHPTTPNYETITRKLGQVAAYIARRRPVRPRRLGAKVGGERHTKLRVWVQAW